MKTIVKVMLLTVVTTFSTNHLVAQWTKSSSTGLLYKGMVQSFVVSGKSIFAGTDRYGAFVSTDDGRSWTALTILSSTDNVTAIITAPNGAGGTTLFAGVEENGIFRSTDNGKSWSAVNTGLSNLDVLSLASSGSYLYAGTMGEGVFHSTDNGSNWIEHPRCGVHRAVALAVSGTNLLSGADWITGMEISYDNATSWHDANTGLTDSSITTIAVNGENIYAGTRAGAFLSTNGGTIWSEINTGLPQGYVNSFAVYTTQAGMTCIFAGSWNGVFVSTNNGTSWTDVSAGLTNKSIRSLVVSGKNLVAGTWYGGVWTRPLSEIVTSVESPPEFDPQTIHLEQNYPNPVRSSTAIRFSLNETAFTTLKIYNVYGEEVETLISDELQQGSHQVQWNTKSRPAGVYICRLQVGSASQTRMMIVVR